MSSFDDEAKIAFQAYVKALKDQVNLSRHSLSLVEDSRATSFLNAVQDVEFSVDVSDNREGYVAAIKALLGCVSDQIELAAKDPNLNPTSALYRDGSELKTACELARNGLPNDVNDFISSVEHPFSPRP